jgi:putative MATE family efflux protein
MAKAELLVSAPIVPTLLRMSVPNLLSMTAAALVAVAETSYVGRLGTPPLAGMALVFPVLMLLQMMSAGAMGGGISSAISRALGARDQARAQALALHAAVIGLAAGLLFTLVFLTFGPAIYRLLGGSGEALAQALRYSNVVFLGATGIWLTHTFASVLRGTGNMRIPAIALLGAAMLQVIIGGGFGLGIGPLPQLGMAGIGLGLVVAYGGSALLLFWWLRTGRARLRLEFHFGVLTAEMFRDILKVGALSSFSSLQAVFTFLIFTRLVSRFGTAELAGYGIGIRLEFLLIPIAFAIGVACVPMVGMAIGAGDIARARRIAWSGATLAALIVGSVGVVVALAPNLWARLFTDDPAVLAAAASYFALAGPAYVFFGFGQCLFFAAQGFGKILGPVLAQTARLVIVASVGFWLAAIGSPAWAVFALVGVGMVAYGLSAALAVALTRWEPRRTAKP